LEQYALAQEIGFAPAEHLALDQFESVNVPLYLAGAPLGAEPGHDGTPVPSESGGESPQFRKGARLGVSDPRFELLRGRNER
jgi:hypothetical protein